MCLKSFAGFEIWGCLFFFCGSGAFLRICGGGIGEGDGARETGLSEGVFVFECGYLGGDEARCRPPGRRLANIIFVRNNRIT